MTGQMYEGFQMEENLKALFERDLINSGCWYSREWLLKVLLYSYDCVLSISGFCDPRSRNICIDWSTERD